MHLKSLIVYEKLMSYFYQSVQFYISLRETWKIMKTSGEVETFSAHKMPPNHLLQMSKWFLYLYFYKKIKINGSFPQNLSILWNSSPFILNKAWIDKLLTISLGQGVILIFSVRIPVLNTYTWCTYIVPWLSSLGPSVGMALCPFTSLDSRPSV